jgi:HEXXH motif-containing protein
VTLSSEQLLSFAPDGARGRFLDVRMHRMLTESLGHVATACAEDFPAATAALQPLLDRLTQGARVPAQAFGLYFQLADKVMSDDRSAALAAAEALGRMAPRAAGVTMLQRGAAEAAPLEDVLALRLGEEAARFAPIDAAMHRDFAALVREGADLLCQGYPDLHAEIDAIVTTMLFAQAPEGAVMQFDGASHYQFWGLLLLNPVHHRTPLAVAEVLAHEAGHSLLFGLTVDEPLVLNPDEELFPSPLRRDPRPMDGIYHAVFVSARMALAMETLAESGALTAPEQAMARAAAAADRENFAKGFETVAAHGRLTQTGAAIIENARAWIGQSGGA